MDILQKIIEQITIDEQKLFDQFDKNPPMINKVTAIRTPKPLKIGTSHPFFIITESKKASPSKGVIRQEYDPVTIARSYEKGGASAISVITEKNFFQGKKEHLRQVRQITHLPILRKDFIIHPHQVLESFELGADIVLLIAAALSDEKMKTLYQFIRDLGMTPLVEVHDIADLQRALLLSPPLIGINNRDLKTFKVDLNVSLKLKKNIPTGISVISESGIENRKCIELLKASGFDGALIGESLLRKENLTLEVRKIAK